MIEPYPDETALNPNDIRFHDNVYWKAEYRLDMVG